ncbi:MAG: YtpR family tRNA-binding protein [Lentilactobacillus parabuchneri]|uniref:YtpR family tRNA-binding protein n=1 Tax=Lentilactobacillus parabuchneri TaxID=152331 RepID=UPI003F9D100B
MLIASYNPQSTGDTMVLIMNPDVADQQVSIHDDVARIFDEKTNRTLGYNFLKASEILPEIVTENGQVNLTSEQVQKLNDYLTNHGFPGDVEFDDQPKFVVGYVESLEDHPNSNHLQIATTDIDRDKKLQIVSGSPNMRENIKVVVALSGAMMPDGQIIWPGELRGVKSEGMICSGRELALPNAPQVPGALILPDDYQVGTAFDFKKAQHLFD